MRPLSSDVRPHCRIPMVAVMHNNSIADIDEGDLISQLLADIQWHSRITGVHGIPSDSLAYLEVPLVGLPGEPKGDIDILLVPPGRPDEAIAVQAKRVKISARTFVSGVPNKLGELETLWRQSELLANIGFSRVFSFVFVVADSREKNQGRYSYSGLTKELASLIKARISPQKLDERVGLVNFELVQPLDDRPLGAGTFRGQALRLARRAAQPADVTEWVNCQVLGTLA